MEIKYCDSYRTAIVEMSRDELGIILCRDFGDRFDYANKGFNEDLIGKEFDLKEIKKKINNYKRMCELKKYTKENAEDILKICEKLSFSIEEIGDVN